jgi:hypothetical protein
MYYPGMHIRKIDFGGSAGGHEATGQHLAEVVVRRCIDAHRDWFQLSSTGALAVCVMWAGATLPLMQWRLAGLGLMMWPLIGMPSAFMLLLLLQGLGIAPSMDGVHSHWRKPAQPQHLRAMELELPQAAYALWTARFRQHVASGEPVTVENLVEFANALERERVNQNHLHAQQMIFDQNQPG